VIFQTLLESAERGELLLVNGGMCRYHRRQDGQCTIREILVLPERRCQGIGRRLVEAVRSLAEPQCLVVRCPGNLESNGFWERMGFDLVETVEGINTWRRACG